MQRYKVGQEKILTKIKIPNIFKNKKMKMYKSFKQHESSDQKWSYKLDKFFCEPTKDQYNGYETNGHNLETFCIPENL
ncbi:hypothetical protein Hanom_Chr12g01160461 [Helianthus anomalus]